MNDEEFEDRMAKQLEDNIPQYDDDTMARLAEARNAALNAIPQKAEKQQGFRWANLAFGGAACIALSVAMFLFPAGQDTKQDHIASSFEILMEAEDVEMLQEDIEFYVWLEDELENEAS